MAKEAVKIQDGGVIDYTATAAIANGDVVPLTDRVGVALDDAVPGDVISLALDGVFEMQALDEDSFEVGAVVYFDTISRMATAASTDATTIAGIATTSKAGGTAGAVNVKFGTAVALQVPPPLGV